MKYDAETANKLLDEAFGIFDNLMVDWDVNISSDIEELYKKIDRPIPSL